MPETIKGVDAQRVHIRAEEILTVALRAQGRDPASYSYSEYLIATEQAVAEESIARTRIPA
jgi:hypothetical protein